MRAIAAGMLLLFFLISAVMFSAYRGGKKLSYDIVLPTLGGAGEFSTKEIKSRGRVYVINVFASWCTTCMHEHQMWLEIAKEGLVDLYGIDYIDIEENALAWLKKHGNPYIMVAADNSGKSSKEFGVTGVPETFVFNKKGKLVQHISGAITKELWKEQVYKLITEP